MNCIGVRSALHSALSKYGVDPNMVDPWFFPTPNQYATLLEQKGFAVQSISLIPRPTPLPRHKGLFGWLEVRVKYGSERFSRSS